MRVWKNRLRVLAVVCLMTFLLPTIAFASGTVQVTCSDGGTVTPATEGLTLANGTMTVNTDAPVKLLITPNEGYTIHSVFRDRKQLEISGTQPQTVSVAPKGGAVDLQVTFIPVEFLDEAVAPQTGQPEETPQPTKEPATPPDTDKPQEKPELDTSNDMGLGGLATEQGRPINFKLVGFIATIVSAVALTVFIMVKIFKKKNTPS